MACSCSNFSGVRENPWPKAATAGSIAWPVKSLRVLSSPATAPGRSVSGVSSIPIVRSQCQKRSRFTWAMAFTMPTLLDTCKTVGKSIKPLARLSWLKIGQPPMLSWPVSATRPLALMAFSCRATARLIGLKVEPGS